VEAWYHSLHLQALKCWSAPLAWFGVLAAMIDLLICNNSCKHLIRWQNLNFFATLLPLLIGREAAASVVLA
jgi:hypothetical protein